MEIELVRKEEFEEVHVIARQVHLLHVGWRPDLFKYVEKVISEELFNEYIENKNLYVAKKNGEIVGYMIIYIKEKNSPGVRYRKQLTIEVLAIKDGNRRQGIGTMLLNFAKNYAKENGCTDLYITVNEENIPAINAYEKFGFKVKNIAYSMEI